MQTKLVIICAGGSSVLPWMSAAPTFGKHVPADGISDGWRMNNAGPQKRSPFFTVIPSGGKRQIDLKGKRTLLIFTFVNKLSANH
jgi:hypothetical protein